MKAVGYDSSTGAIQYLIKTICPVCKNIKESIHSSWTLYVCSDKIEERVCSQRCQKGKDKIMSNMWLFTPDGFFSPRYDEFCNEDEVMIRARCRDDLVKLAGMVGQKKYKIVELPEADYLYRMKINKYAWASYCAGAALDGRPTSVTGGLKNDKKIDNRYLTYLSIWESMILLQEFYDAERKGDVKKMKEFNKIFESYYFIEQEPKEPKGCK